MSSRPLWYWLRSLTLWLVLVACGCASTSPATQLATGRTAVDRAVILRPSEIIPIHVEDLSLGARSAPVTLVSFFDLECPFCGQAWDTLEQLRVKYGPTKLRVVVKHLPLAFHKNAANAARSVMQVQRRHGDLAAAALLRRVLHEREPIGSVALEAAVEQSTPVDDLDAPSSRVFSVTLAEQLQRDEALAVRLGIDGTPAFRINGIALDGALPASEFERLIDQELLEVQQLVHKGVLPGDVYADRVATNHQPPRVEPTKALEQDLTRWAVPIGDAPQIGPSIAPVTIVAFMDYECPFCQRGLSTLKQLREKYPSQLRIAWRHRPLDFHKHATSAAEFAAEVRRQKGDVAFWEATDLLFSQQAELSDATYASVASRLGLDRSAWQKRKTTGESTLVVAADSDVGDAFGVEGTPQFFLNGLRLKGSKSLEEFVKIIEQELEAADALKQRGTAPERVGEALMVEAKSAPEPASIAPAARLPDGPSMGSAAARVTIHAFSDFQCPFCQRADVTVRALLAKYPKDLRLVWHDLPLGFHERARPAATLAREVLAQKGDAVFFQISQTLFSSQSDMSEAALLGHARALGIRDEPLLASRREQAHGQAIDRDRQLAEDLHISGTPTFIVGQYLLEGAQPMRSFERLLRLELAKQRDKKAPTKR